MDQKPTMVEKGNGGGKQQSSVLSGDCQIYLDYNATTPLEPEVLSAIHEALQDAWGNPSSAHHAGVKAKKIIDKARKSIAGMIGGRLEDIIFTSGGTEANNMVLQTALSHFWQTYPGINNTDRNSQAHNHGDSNILPHIITSNLEHDSIKLVLEHFEASGKADVTFVGASHKTGRVEVDDVIAAVRPTTCMISVMMANNETGILQPIMEIVEKVRGLKRDFKVEVPRILIHTDAAQAIGKVKVNALDLDVDFLTIVGHKFYGPRIGALYVKGPGRETPLQPMLYGGGQERNFRPGTENTGMIAGLGKAAELVVENLDRYESHMREIRDYLEQQLVNTFGSENLHFNGKFAASDRLPNTCNVSFLGKTLFGQSILSHARQIQASVGAACHSGNTHRASPILLAIGIQSDVATNALRLSVGRETTKSDIDIIVKDLKLAVEHLSKPELL